MIKATLRYEYSSQTPKVMAVLLKNNVDIKIHYEFWNYYFTCVFENKDQLNQVLLALNSNTTNGVVVTRQRELFDFTAFWEKLKELWNK